MALSSRWARPPAELRRLFDPAERILAMADTDSGSVVAATPAGLWLPDGDSWGRIGWDEIVKATWNERGLSVISGRVDSDGIVEDLPPVEFGLPQPRNLPGVVRTRVESSIVRSEQVFVPGGSARLVARRVPGRDGIFWTGRIDSSAIPTADGREYLRQYLQRVRAGEAAQRT